MKHDVIIIGGGLSGLSAAVELASLGFPALLLEAHQYLGGRTRSFVDDATGDVVDNGQHLMMGCYKETRRLLRTIGADHLAKLQPNLHIDFLHPARGFSSLSCPSLPAPLHVLAGLLGLKSLSFNDRLKLTRVGVELLRNPGDVENELEEKTVDEWLTSLGQPPENRKYLWDVIAIGSLNDDPKVVSALLFYRVLRAAFLGQRQNSAMLVPTVGLSELFVEPSVRYLDSHGSEAKTGCGVEELVREGDRVVGVRCADGITREAGAFVVAIPQYAFADLVLASKTLKPQEFQAVRAFESSPIITINLWLDRQVLQQEFAAFLDSRVQWIFNRTKMLNRSTGSGQYLALVISGAGPFVEMGKDELVDLAMEDLRTALPEALSAKVVHSQVIKERRATFSPKPGIERLRPRAATAFENLFLAGDWTATGFPATIEGAVMSGKSAALLVERYLRRSVTGGL